MPLQNRVTPSGHLEAVAARGAWLGNRGILHNDQKHIVAPWRHKAWVTWRLSFQDRQRSIFSPHHYSELFFLDEATAFAAGHRPCAECRRERYSEFKASWCAANHHIAATSKLPVAHIDKQLHAERAARAGGKVTYSEQFQHLPSGTFVELEGAPYLLWDEELWQWSHHGYDQSRPALPPSKLLQVLTPASIVAMFRLGFKPQVHESARG